MEYWKAVKIVRENKILISLDYHLLVVAHSMLNLIVADVIMAGNACERNRRRALWNVLKRLISKRYKQNLIKGFQ